MNLALVTLGFAGADSDHEVREVDGPNDGPRIRAYLANTDPPINTPAPYCAAGIQKWSDLAAKLLHVENPLDAVRLEAFVQSYYDWAEAEGRIVTSPREGDLVCFRFNHSRWDHIGIVAIPPDSSGAFWTVEANTGDDGGRDGDGVYVKLRSTALGYPTCFIRWDVPKTQLRCEDLAA